MASPPGIVERRRVRLSGAAALTIVGTIIGLVVARRMFIAAHRPLSWAAGCVVAAVILDPIVDRLAVVIRRGPAVIITFVAMGALVVGITYLVFDDVERALDRLQEVAPDAAIAIEGRDDQLGQLARDFQLGDRVTDAVDALDERVTGGNDVLRSTAGTAPTYFVCAILTIFLMSYGPRIARAALEEERDLMRRARIAHIVGPAVTNARQAVLLAVAEGLAIGFVTGTIATLLDLPAPAAIGFAAGVLSVLPYVGLVLGAVPLLLLVLAFRSLPVAVTLLVVVIVAQLVDSYVVRPQMARQSVDIGLVVPWVVAVLGYSIYGVGGAAFATVYAVFGLAVLDRLEAANDVRARQTASSPSASGAPSAR
jgi:predicted PurR-regulated permease PerM